ncbi:DUF4340 domain-containing protein [Maricaulis sp. MIT060901]|uniref:DUF4340 domain-containing protein n=1 Tax=Maricaulis sp. MIT060901 TaxID=3096993 RepID=UPI00399BBBC2
MSQRLDQQRLKHLGVTGAAAVIMLVAAISLSFMDARQVWAPSVSGPVLANWSENVQSAREIEIINAQERFVIARTDAGWVMPSRDGYPVRPERLAALDNLLMSLEYEGARTADPAKHARLSLATEGEENGGNRVILRDAEGNVLEDILLGTARGDTLYLRTPGEARTYAARFDADVDTSLLGQSADEWLALDFLALGRNDIAAAEIRPETGPQYRLVRAAQTSRNFSLREPTGWQPITAGAGNGPATALGRLRFRDVRRMDRLTGSVVAFHTAETFSGMRVTLDIIAQGETRWARIRTTAVTDDAEDDAARIINASEGWAFLLSDLAVDRMIRPLDQIANPRAAEADAP